MIRCFIASYSGLDPMEDTESHPDTRRATPPGAVTVGSIRWRILKEHLQAVDNVLHLGYSGLDPMEEGWRSPDCLR